MLTPIQIKLVEKEYVDFLKIREICEGSEPIAITIYAKLRM